MYKLVLSPLDQRHDYRPSTVEKFANQLSTAKMVSFSLALLTAFVGTTFAHPGHDVRAEAAARAEYRARPEYRSLSHCASTIKARDGPLIQRRMDMVDKLREKRGIQKRGWAEVLRTDHESSLDVTPESSAADIFGSDNACILQAETTEGPYCRSSNSQRALSKR